MKKHLFILLFLITGNLHGQKSTSRCSADDLFTQNVQRYPYLLEERAEVEAFVQDWIRENQGQSFSREIITIPVVVHVVWHKPFENIADVQIHAQIDALNIDYRAMNDNLEQVPDEFRGLITDTNIEFCLATVNPQGFETSGITRRKTDKELIGSIRTNSGKPMICYTELGGKDNWDPDKYLNIWIGSTGLVPLGKACKPGECSPAEDGIVIDPQAFGTTCNAIEPYHLGRTATHEIGHYLNLFHPWGVESENCESDDFVEDTPLQSKAYLGCPEFPQSSCGSPDMFMNFMDYSDDICLSMFTPGQVMRMLATLAGPRSGLVESNGCKLYRTAETSLTIFPNPANECLHIDLNYPIPKAVNFRIYDELGRLISEKDVFAADIRSINIRELNAGIYFIHIKTDDAQFTEKLMIHRGAL